MVMYDEKRVKFGVHGRCMMYLVVCVELSSRLREKRDVVQIQSNPAKKVGWELFECALCMDVAMFAGEKEKKNCGGIKLVDG